MPADVASAPTDVACGSAEVASASADVARAATDAASASTSTGDAASPDAAFGGAVRRGTVWSLVGYGGSQAMRFGGNLLLTRLLHPEAFGTMALVNALLQGLQLFSDVGIGPSIIQNRRGDDPSFLNVAWTMQLMRGTLLWVVACVAAMPFAAFYGDAQLAWVLPVAGTTALIGGFCSTRIFSMYREVEIRRIAMLELGSQAAGLGAMLAFALVQRSIWALVAGAIAGAFAKTVLSHTLLPGIANRWRFDVDAFRVMLRFGRWIFLSTLLTFLVGQSDRLVFGKLVPLAMLGVYSIAAMIAILPMTALARVASGVFFPVYSREHAAGRDLAPVFRRVRLPLCLLAGWMIGGLVGGGPAAVRLLYDQRYVEAGWILQLLALASWFGFLDSTNGAALLARGESQWTAASSGAKLVGMCALIPIGFHVAGFPGAVAGLAAADVLRYGVSAWAVARAGLRGWPQDLLLTAWLLGSALVARLASGVAERAGASRFVTALVVLVVVSVAWAPAGAPAIARAWRAWKERRAARDRDAARAAA